ncbi:MAG: TetR/AcrR family transcriptional regulator [Alphaproteobacteria bacterium]|uniref:TetR/AcrR family transcriptional regulator n=1 Tax=Candidatus Nitrobium versatile TaxID=2884831 RepID=A0A953M3V6_9BACT|nr:TetR/AcrR family transcriptional regulator [Candidatus Nitrobium versatile]
MSKRKQERIDSPEEHAARRRLLRAALELFMKKGYAATSVREIVDAAGLTKPVLYYYFGSKEGIYFELMREPFERLGDILDQATRQEGGFCEKIIRIFDLIFALFTERIGEARLMYSIYYGPPQGAPFIDFEAYHRKIREVILHLIKEGVARGEVNAANDRECLDWMWVLIGALNVILEEQLCQAPPTMNGEGLSRIVSLVIRGMGGMNHEKRDCPDDHA